MSSKGDEDRRVAVVTDGAGAIGGAIVARLAPDHTVVVLDRTGDVVVDLGDTDDVRRAAELVLDRHGRCDVFVHAAATFKSGPLEQVKLDSWRQVQAVNVESALLLTQAFVPGMRDRGFGRVIFIVSNTFWSPPDGQMLSYVASKPKPSPARRSPPMAAWSCAEQWPTKPSPPDRTERDPNGLDGPTEPGTEPSRV